MNDTTGGVVVISRFLAQALINFGSTHSFISPSFARKLHVKPEHLDYELHVSTPTRNSQRTNIIYRNSNVRVGDKSLVVNLIALNMYDFDVILGMDWLAAHRASVDCYRKVLTFSLPEPLVLQFGNEK